MKHVFQFTLTSLESQYRVGLELGYTFLTCLDYAREKTRLPSHTVVNRVDVDFSLKKAGRLLDLFNRLGIKATFFIRLHAPEYNPFSFENFRILKEIVDSGHEVGYHSEVVDQAAIWGEDPVDCLRSDLRVLQEIIGTKVHGVASHGGSTGLNNLDFWRSRSAADFGLVYEAYDKSESFGLFRKSLYVSDSEWTRWKCYRAGVLEEGNSKSLGEHLCNLEPLIYLLVHPETYFNLHIYE